MTRRECQTLTRTAPRRHWLVCLLAALLCGCSGAAADQRLKIEVGNPVAKEVPSGDPEVSSFRVRFSLRVSNAGDELVNIGGDPLPVFSVHYRSADGSWKNLVQNMVVYPANQKFSPCKSLPPGRTTVIRHAQDGLALLKGKLRELGNQPLLRLRLQFTCSAPNGESRGTQEFNTEPFVLKLPAPGK